MPITGSIWPRSQQELGEAGTLYHMSISYDMGTRDVVDFISMRPEGPVAYKCNILNACHNSFFFSLQFIQHKKVSNYIATGK